MGRAPVTDRFWTILLLASGSVHQPGTALSAGKMAARSGDGVFGSAQVGQRPLETLPAQLDRQLSSGRVQS